MKIREITDLLARSIPLFYQEAYDNSGLQVGDPDNEVTSALLSPDVTEEVVNEAIERGAGIIISHHPLIFSGLKSISGKTYIERAVIKAIKNDIAIYSAHTNLDLMPGGVSSRMASKLGLNNVESLSPVWGKLNKLAVFVPLDHVAEVRDAIFEAGAGHIGNYDRCSFNLSGEGTFRAGEGSDPYSGTPGLEHTEKEVRIETIVPDNLLQPVLKAMIDAHPYEEVAYDIYRLGNSIPGSGLGCVGDLHNEVDEIEFLENVANIFGAQQIKYTGLRGIPVKRVALCGGSGSSLIGNAISTGADIFITGDLKYHSFFESEGKMILADIGHHESEKCSLEIFDEIITKKFSKFAVLFSKINTNPINYLRAWKK